MFGRISGVDVMLSRRCKSSKRLIQPSRLYQRCIRCCAEQGGQGRQYETEFFRKLFGTPPPPKQDSAGGMPECPCCSVHLLQLACMLAWTAYAVRTMHIYHMHKHVKTSMISHELHGSQDC